MSLLMSWCMSAAVVSFFTRTMYRIGAGRITNMRSTFTLHDASCDTFFLGMFASLLFTYVTEYNAMMFDRACNGRMDLSVGPVSKNVTFCCDHRAKHLVAGPRNSTTNINQENLFNPDERCRQLTVYLSEDFLPVSPTSNSDTTTMSIVQFVRTAMSCSPFANNNKPKSLPVSLDLVLSS